MEGGSATDSMFMQHPAVNPILPVLMRSEDFAWYDGSRWGLLL
jgi:hypothetical protein